MANSLLSLSGQVDPVEFVPCKWRCDQLGQTCKIFGGGRLGFIKEKHYQSSGVTAFSAAGPDGYVEKAEVIGEDGVILSAIGANCGRCFYATGEWTTLANVQAIIPRRLLNARYLYYYVNRDGYWERSGSAQPFIKPSSIRTSWIVYPESSVEQSEIVEILSTVDRAIEQTEALIAKQQRIKTGLMQDLLTRGIDEHGNLRSEATHQFKDSPLGRIPMEWGALTVDELLARKILAGVQDGNHGEKHPKSCDFVPDGIHFVMASDISRGFIDVEHAKKITEQQYLGLRIGFAQPRDVLLSHKASIGFVALVPEWLTRVMLTPQVTYYRVGNLSLLSPDYLGQYLRSGAYQKALKGLAKQSTRDYIGILAQRKIFIAFPTRLKEQEAIALILCTQDLSMEVLQRALAKARSFKTALMQDLLTGKRRVTALLDRKDGVNA